MSWISTDKQNFVTISRGVSFPRMREIAHQNVYSASFCPGNGVTRNGECQKRRRPYNTLALPSQCVMNVKSSAAGIAIRQAVPLTSAAISLI